MTFPSEPIPKFETEAKKEVLDDNARKFVVESLDDTLLTSDKATNYLLVTDWLEMGEDDEKKLAYKKYANGGVEILLISKVTSKEGRISQKEKISEDEYGKLIKDSIRRVEKVRHEFNYAQGDLDFKMKYDIFADSQLRVLEVDADTDDERTAFNPSAFSGDVSEVTGNLQYYGYRIADVLDS